jgi:hypothetical protein
MAAARFGNSKNGFKGPIVRADTWDESMIKLTVHVATEYPQSEFAKRYRTSTAKARQAHAAPSPADSTTETHPALVNAADPLDCFKL